MRCTVEKTHPNQCSTTGDSAGWVVTPPGSDPHTGRLEKIFHPRVWGAASNQHFPKLMLCEIRPRGSPAPKGFIAWEIQILPPPYLRLKPTQLRHRPREPSYKHMLLEMPPVTLRFLLGEGVGPNQSHVRRVAGRDTRSHPGDFMNRHAVLSSG